MDTITRCLVPHFRIIRTIFGVMLLLMMGSVPTVFGQTSEPSSLNSIFTEAATEFNVPVDLLIAIAWSRSHLHSQVSDFGDYGIMQLPTGNPNLVAQAAQLLKVTEEQVKAENRQNVRGAAAILGQMADVAYPGRVQLTTKEWFNLVIQFSLSNNPDIAKHHAQQVFTILATGMQIQLDTETLVVHAWPDAKPLLDETVIRPLSIDYGPAIWTAAHPTNYTDASRGVGQISKIVIHTMQGYYSTAINMFTQPRGASAHYFIRSSDGEVTQMVRDEDIAWHAGDWPTNQISIGIEHEGFISDGSWYTEAMYQSSAKLVRYLADKYGIPKDRAHIIGHNEVPGCPYSGGGSDCHTDPGTNWDWNYYMSLVAGSPLSEIIVEEPALTPAYTSCGAGAWSRQLNNRGHYFYLTLNTRDPNQSTNSGIWRPNLPQTGNYKVEAYISSRPTTSDCNVYVFDKNDTSDARYTIYHAGGSTTVARDQIPYENQWLDLGTYTFNAGTSGYVRLSDLNNETDFSRAVSFSAIRFVFVPTGPDTIVPTGSLTTPANGITIGLGTLPVAANASDNPGGSGVKQVNFYVRYAAPYAGEWHIIENPDTSSPFQVNWSIPSDLRSQIIELGIHVIDKANNICQDPGPNYTCENPTAKRTVTFVDWIGKQNIEENWIPKNLRYYLNQLSLGADGNLKCAGASGAMMLAMNGQFSGYNSMKNSANTIYDAIKANLSPTTLATELRKLGLTNAKEVRYSKEDGWVKIKAEIDAGRPVMMLSSKVTAAGHYFVIVGYRKEDATREVIVYDPFGRWQGQKGAQNFDRNSSEAGSFKGQWAYYDFDKIWGTDGLNPFNWDKSFLIISIPGQQAGSLTDLVGNLSLPTTDPDIISLEQPDIVTYPGVPINEMSEELYLPLIIRQ